MAGGWQGIGVGRAGGMPFAGVERVAFKKMGLTTESIMSDESKTVA